MSTRGVTGFVLDEKWYVMYNHGDSYPEWLGTHVLEFCKTVTDWDKIKENASKVKLVEETDELYFKLHDLQGEGIFYRIAEGTADIMLDAHLFMADSLFCEWGYILDFDNMLLRVYKGKQKRATYESFLPSDINKSYNEDGFYPVKELYAYDLYNLPEFMLGVTNEFKKEYRLKHLTHT